jgi:hypothetical protein
MPDHDNGVRGVTCLNELCAADLIGEVRQVRFLALELLTQLPR